MSYNAPPPAVTTRKAVYFKPHQILIKGVKLGITAQGSHIALADYYQRKSKWIQVQRQSHSATVTTVAELKQRAQHFSVSSNPPLSIETPNTLALRGGLRNKAPRSRAVGRWAVADPPEAPLTAPHSPAARRAAHCSSTTTDPGLHDQRPETPLRASLVPGYPTSSSLLWLCCSLRLFLLAPPSVLHPFPISVPSPSLLQTSPPNKSPIHFIPTWYLPLRRPKT